MSCAEVRPGCLEFILEGLFHLFDAGQECSYGIILLGRFAAAPYLLLYRSAIKLDKTTIQSVPVADRAASRSGSSAVGGTGNLLTYLGRHWCLQRASTAAVVSLRNRQVEEHSKGLRDPSSMILERVRATNDGAATSVLCKFCRDLALKMIGARAGRLGKVRYVLHTINTAASAQQIYILQLLH